MTLQTPTPPPEPEFLTVAAVADRIGKSEDYKLLTETQATVAGSKPLRKQNTTGNGLRRPK